MNTCSAGSMKRRRLGLSFDEIHSSSNLASLYERVESELNGIDVKYLRLLIKTTPTLFGKFSSNGDSTNEKFANLSSSSKKKLKEKMILNYWLKYA